MGRKKPEKICKCGAGYSSADKSRDICPKCFGIEFQRQKLYQVRPKGDKPRKWQKTTKEESFDEIRVFISKFVDLGGLHGPVIHYRPGDPGFDNLARLYSGGR